MAALARKRIEEAHHDEATTAMLLEIRKHVVEETVSMSPAFDYEGLDEEVLRAFGIDGSPEPVLDRWLDIMDRQANPEGEVTIGVVGKYVGLPDAYKSLHEALTRPYPAYEAVGVRNPGGDYNQLATTLLQIENEFYGLIRPKRVIFAGERPLHALRERGVEYIEVRCMDLDPFEPVGIRADTMRFIDVFLLHCLLSDSPPDSPEEIVRLGNNQHRTAARGREPGLTLDSATGALPLQAWAAQLLDECTPISETVAQVLGDERYVQALAAARRSLQQPDSLPSARVLDTMTRDFEQSYVRFVRAQSQATRSRLMALPYTAELQARFEAQARQSLARQQEIEAGDTMPFEIYRQQYLAPERLGR